MASPREDKKTTIEDRGAKPQPAEPAGSGGEDKPAVPSQLAPEMYAMFRQSFGPLHAKRQAKLESQMHAQVRHHLGDDAGQHNNDNREDARHAIAKEIFEGKSSAANTINRHLDAVRSKIEAPDPTEFWVTRVMPLLKKTYPKLFPKEAAEGRSVLDSWSMAARVLVVMAERAIAELGKENWTPPLPKKRIQAALRLYNRNWTRWRDGHAAALRAPRGSVKKAQHLSVNLSSPLIPRAQRVLLANLLRPLEA